MKTTLRRTVAAILAVAAVPFLTLAAPAPTFAAERQPIQGLLGADFGMDLQSVRTAVEAGGLTRISAQAEDGDTLLSGVLEADGIARTVLFVFPANRDRLALIIEFHDDTTRALALEEALTARYGAPIDEDGTKVMREQLGDQLPEGLEDLRVWADKVNGADRLARLMTFPNYVAVEYIDSTLLNALN